MKAAAPSVSYRGEKKPDGYWVAIEGDLGARRFALPDAAPEGTRRVVVDLSRVPSVTGIAAARLFRIGDRFQRQGAEVAFHSDQEEHRRLLSLYLRPIEPAPPETRVPAFDRFVLAARELRDAALRYLLLLRASLACAGRQLFVAPESRGEEVWSSVARMGLAALPLVGLISLLVGAILALNGAPLLRTWGQELRIADLVGLSITKEIGPLIVAILVAGRSGAALTAEIATMRVSEEIDALEVIGISPIDYLVAPRLRALVIAVPALTLFADILGVFGGFLIGMGVLELPLSSLWRQTLLAIEPNFVIGGLLKAVCFGVVIATVAAHQGLRTRGGAAAVGRATTRSVVLSILWIILVDALFTAGLTAWSW